MPIEAREYGDSSDDVVFQDQSPLRKPPSPPADEEKGTHLRFLLSNTESGSVIGKGGSTICDIQSQSGSRIQLSRNYEYFPGTPDRIVMVSGSVGSILRAVDLILSKLLDEFYAEDGGQVDPVSKIRLIAPNSSCGSIIGKGGAEIRSLIEVSGADIKISPQDVYFPGLHDRLVTVAGTLEELLVAVELILLKLVKDPYYQQPMHAPFSYAAFMHNGINFGPIGFGAKHPSDRLHDKEERISSVTMGVPDENIGLVVGRHGRSIVEISQLSGAKIKISDRGDFISGTSNRKVTITGSERAVHVAESMITRKVASVGEFGTRRSISTAEKKDLLPTDGGVEK